MSLDTIIIYKRKLSQNIPLPNKKTIYYAFFGVCVYLELPVKRTMIKGLRHAYTLREC